MFNVETCFVTFAQQGGTGPPLPTDTTPQETSTAQDGSAAANGGGTTGGGGTGGQGPPAGMNQIWLIMIGVVVAILIFSMLGGRKEKKKREQLLSSIKKHDKVQTIGGVVGSIVEVKNDQVVLKVDETSNTRITFARSAIQQVLDSSELKSEAGPS